MLAEKLFNKLKRQFGDNLKAGNSMMLIHARDVILEDFQGEDREEYYRQKMREILDSGYFAISDSKNLYLAEKGFDYYNFR
jgi:hypothetical protein